MSKFLDVVAWTVLALCAGLPICFLLFLGFTKAPVLTGGVLLIGWAFERTSYKDD